MAEPTRKFGPIPTGRRGKASGSDMRLPEAGPSRGSNKKNKNTTAPISLTGVLPALEPELAVQVAARMGQGLVIADAVGVIEYANPAMARMLGCPLEALLGSSLDDFTLEVDKPWLVGARASVALGEGATLELKLQHLDGRTVHALVTIAPRQRDGQVLGSIVVVSNLTQRKSIEEALEHERDFVAAVIDTTASLVCVLDPNGRVVRLNQAISNVLNVDLSKLMGHDFERLIVAEEIALCREALDVVRESKQTIELEMHLQLGEHQALINWTITALLANGQLQHIVLTGIDITQRRNAERLAKQAQEETNRVARAKGQFLATLSHELRTPLSAIIGFTQLLKNPSMGGLDATQLDYLEEIDHASQHLLALMNDVLDLSKIEAGRMELDLETLEIVSVLETCLGLFRGRASSNGVQLELLTSGMVRLQADARKLKQVIMNLVSNAIKFTPSGGRVIVSAKRDAGFLEINITDTGVGIAKEDQSKLFRPFTQVDRSLSRRHDGTGLGLALTKQLVELHQGSIAVQSELGKGASFVVRLPLRSRG